MKQPKPTIAAAAPYAHYLGFDAPSGPQSAIRNLSSKTIQTVRQAIRSTPSAGASALERSPTHTSATAPSRSGGKSSMPFTAAMGGFRTRTTGNQPQSVQTMHFPEMQNGFATGRSIEVRVSTAAEPEIDAAGVASRILAVAKRVRGEA